MFVAFDLPGSQCICGNFSRVLINWASIGSDRCCSQHTCMNLLSIKRVVHSAPLVAYVAFIPLCAFVVLRKRRLQLLPRDQCFVITACHLWRSLLPVAVLIYVPCNRTIDKQCTKIITNNSYTLRQAKLPHTTCYANGSSPRAGIVGGITCRTPEGGSKPTWCTSWYSIFFFSFFSLSSRACKGVPWDW